MSVFEKEVQVLFLTVSAQMGPADLEDCAKAAVEMLDYFSLLVLSWDLCQHWHFSVGCKTSFQVPSLIIPL